MQKHSSLTGRLWKDIFWFALSVTIALSLIHTGAIETFLGSAVKLKLLGAFIAGLFFTSLFTIAPAGIVLVHIAGSTDIVLVAFIGALGAMLGDLIIFKFLESNLTDDINSFLSLPRFKRMRKLFFVRKLRILRPFIGAVVIVSPLPDEIGLALLGLSKVPISTLLPLTFTLNFFGILLICYSAGLL